MSGHPTIEDGLAALPQTRLPDGSILSFRVEGVGPVLARWSETEGAWEPFTFPGAGAAQPAAPAAGESLNPDKNLADLLDVIAARKALGLSAAAVAEIGRSRGQVAPGDHEHEQFAHLFTATAEQLSLHIDRINRIEDGSAARDANLHDLTDPAEARAALGLGTAALAEIGDRDGQVAAGDHDHVSLRSAVSHVAERVSGLAGAALTRGRNLADLEDVEVARRALGLGSVATAEFGTAEGTAAVGDHQHAGTLRSDRNLADLLDVIAARKALGLGTAAVAGIGPRRGEVASGDHSHRAALLDVTRFGWDTDPALALAAAAGVIEETGALGVAIPPGRWAVSTLPAQLGRIEGAGSATVLVNERGGPVFVASGPARIAHLTVEGTVEVTAGGCTLDDVDVDHIAVGPGVAGLALLNVRFSGYGKDIVAAEDARDLRATLCAFSGGIDAPGGIHLAACSGPSDHYVPVQPEPTVTADSETTEGE